MPFDPRRHGRNRNSNCTTLYTVLSLVSNKTTKQKFGITKISQPNNPSNNNKELPILLTVITPIIIISSSSSSPWQRRRRIEAIVDFPAFQASPLSLVRSRLIFSIDLFQLSSFRTKLFQKTHRLTCLTLLFGWCPGEFSHLCLCFA